MSAQHVTTAYFSDSVAGCVKMFHRNLTVDVVEDVASECMSRAMLTLVSMPQISEAVVSYFYGAERPRERFRLPGCADEPEDRGGQGAKGNKATLANMWRARDAHATCLWSNMAFGKLSFVLLLARALKLTHVVESGRMGGLSLAHYHHFGFELVSIDMYPTEPHTVHRSSCIQCTVQH